MKIRVKGIFGRDNIEHVKSQPEKKKSLIYPRKKAVRHQTPLLTSKNFPLTLSLPSCYNEGTSRPASVSVSEPLTEKQTNH